MAKFKFEPLGNISDKISVQKMTNEENSQSWLRISKLYLDKTTGELRPSKDGISVPAELVESLVDLIKEKWG